jgi:uncharacterized protein (DUF433 family)
MQDYRQYITSNPNILFGKPAIKDTRIAVEQILDELAGGRTIEELLEEYPRLTRAKLSMQHWHSPQIHYEQRSCSQITLDLYSYVCYSLLGH